MKPSQSNTSDFKSTGAQPPSAATSIPSDPPPAYTPNPDFSTSSPSGDTKSWPNNNATSTVPSASCASSSRSDHSVLVPTAQPVPGRPLLHEGQCLVQSSGCLTDFWLVFLKGGNTGYKNDDPYHPCKSCWKKYGRPYTSALAHSWAAPTTSASPSDSKHPPANQPPPQNYQRPLLLTNFHPSPAAPYTGIVMNHSYMRPGLIERGAQQNRIRPAQPQSHPQPPLVAPPPPGSGNEKPGYEYMQGSAVPYSSPPHPPFASPQQYPATPNGYAGPQGALHVAPGDPRIGGV
ncbi:hypothetical protein QFC21_002331 [Naganishia friedmannii]|uniref:Uncharacterized protein n=1 Tax=Naganishia friedmannii TaxID=89922 RepID=A0ACC2VWN6_9TREE|nr:hypothetical protein QFC21_002331 [Naganishia friedmannii]